MSNASCLKDLLRPLGVYKLEDSFLGAELDSLGRALDELQEQLELVQREMCLTTAQGEGVERVAALFARRPVTQDPQQLALSLAALSRIGADSFTLSSINDTIAGCGLNAVVAEGDAPGVVAVRFPQVAGVPEGFEYMRAIIEDILPAHLLVQYLFWYQTWEELNARQLTWQAIHEQGMTWEEFETLVE